AQGIPDELGYFFRAGGLALFQRLSTPHLGEVLGGGGIEHGPKARAFLHKRRGIGGSAHSGKVNRFQDEVYNLTEHGTAERVLVQLRAFVVGAARVLAEVDAGGSTVEA